MTAAALRLNAVRIGPGLVAGLLMAVLAKLLSQSLHVPAPLLAVVLGMMLGALGLQGQLGAGLDLFAKPGLRLGVAMMGAQISWTEFAALGGPAVLASGAVCDRRTGDRRSGRNSPGSAARRSPDRGSRLLDLRGLRRPGRLAGRALQSREPAHDGSGHRPGSICSRPWPCWPIRRSSTPWA